MAKIRSATRLFIEVIGVKFRWLMVVGWTTVSVVVLARTEVFPAAYKNYTIHWLILQFPWYWWVIGAMLLTLVIMFFSYHSHYEKTQAAHTALLKELHKEWAQTMSYLPTLVTRLWEGKILYDPNLVSMTPSNWAIGTEKDLLDKDHRRRFNKDIAERTEWSEKNRLHSRLVELQRIVGELKQMPKQLVAYTPDVAKPKA